MRRAKQPKHIGRRLMRKIACAYLAGLGLDAGDHRGPPGNPPPTQDRIEQLRREVPSNAEMPLTDIRKAVHEFVTTNGTRPAGVEWQLDR